MKNMKIITLLILFSFINILPSIVHSTDSVYQLKTINEDLYKPWSIVFLPNKKEA